MVERFAVARHNAALSRKAPEKVAVDRQAENARLAAEARKTARTVNTTARPAVARPAAAPAPRPAASPAKAVAALQTGRAARSAASEQQAVAKASRKKMLQEAYAARKGAPKATEQTKAPAGNPAMRARAAEHRAAKVERDGGADKRREGVMTRLGYRAVKQNRATPAPETRTAHNALRDEMAKVKTRMREDAERAGLGNTSLRGRLGDPKEILGASELIGRIRAGRGQADAKNALRGAKEYFKLEKAIKSNSDKEAVRIAKSLYGRKRKTT